MRPILAGKILEQWGQDNAAGRAGVVETLLAHFPLVFGCMDAVLLVGCCAVAGFGTIQFSKEACDMNMGRWLCMHSGNMLVPFSDVGVIRSTL